MGLFFLGIVHIFVDVSAKFQLYNIFSRFQDQIGSNDCTTWIIFFREEGFSKNCKNMSMETSL